MGYARRAAEDYRMIGDGDKIAVGLSGGKDSVALLTALAKMRDYYPLKYSLAAITVSLGFNGFDTAPLTALCEKLQIDHVIVETNIGGVVFNDRMEKNPCSLCSKMRKGALYGKAKELNCNKVALGHNRDDCVQTFFLSMFYEGRIHTFSPVIYLDHSGLTVVRPLVYAPEKEISAYVKKDGLTVVLNPCPVNGRTQREDIKSFIRNQSKKYKNFEKKIFGQITRLPVAGWEKDDNGKNRIS